MAGSHGFCSEWGKRSSEHEKQVFPNNGNNNTSLDLSPSPLCDWYPFTTHIARADLLRIWLSFQQHDCKLICGESFSCSRYCIKVKAPHKGTRSESRLRNLIYVCFFFFFFKEFPNPYNRIVSSLSTVSHHGKAVDYMPLEESTLFCH